MVQVLLDLPGAGSVPMGYGHLYSAPANLDAWVGITRPPGWDAAEPATASAACSPGGRTPTAPHSSSSR